jgi:hypothetical protein
MIYDSDLKCGVLTDFDLSILQWEERIGTIAAIRRMLEVSGPTTHPQELESFTWILSCFIRLDSDNGICSTLILGFYLAGASHVVDSEDS